MSVPNEAGGLPLVADKREILLCQAVGDYCLHSHDPEVWELYRIDYAEKLGISRDIIDNEIRARLSKNIQPEIEFVNSYPEFSEKAKHGLAWEFVDAVSPHTEADPVALLMQYLVTAGVLMGRKSFYKVEGDKHFPNLMAVMVGATSKARKGTSWGRVKEVFGPCLDDRIANGLSSGEGLIAHLQDPKDGLTDKRLLVQAPEMSRVFKVCQREGNILSDVIREAWDYGNLRIMTRGAIDGVKL